ncbi:MAG: pilus assembly protein PilE [Betaproteobacteria bacterium HGW-Betaproteobacteria-6]|jgi:type IV pilus assembly protein PilE|nr:MAG: pilus assembly protein PilE [Betaproteobacteria bacterium HGW-Betaproteobacteria-6]PKO88053.1 MAG: pilus assembly protein PilE [Betaproteobacteria bacterium HGW-Betaproteobacteria-10]
MKIAKGFTLIELMVVVAIIGILASIAYPNYLEYMRQTRRSSVEGCMIERTQFMERYYTANMTYANAALTACEGSIADAYTVAFSAQTATTYTIQATPKGVQASDKCGTLTITHLGAKTPTTAGCWK